MQPLLDPRAAGGRPARSAPSEYTLIFFDLETTGLDVSGCDIVQLSAACGERTFNAYVVPRRGMGYSVSFMTGFTVEGDCLLHHGRPMTIVPLQDALADFLTFLRGFHSPVLVAPNVLRFDAPILLRALRGFSLQNELERVTPGFLDTLLLSRDLPACSGVRKFSLQYLVEYFLGKSFEAHDALEDSKALEQLCHAWNPSPMLIRRHLYAVQQIHF
ncbi:protein PML-like [Brienomyrus brachyistius]|uniref:protein PML-like n=1 Tax=Brienomyrus brachyistius TaxID=42636 RepID=UPI0020B1D509|nr:protein PML-like [Brienomyrus brachyistius]